MRPACETNHAKTLHESCYNSGLPGRGCTAPLDSSIVAIAVSCAGKEISMVRATACRSMLIIVCLLLGVTVLGSAQSGKRGQQGPRGVTGAPASPLPSPPERRVALV